jgi:hypothetical protein
VNMEINLEVLYRVGNFFTGRAANGITRTLLLVDR